jgi:ElaB/YqjD/DUF883 family membrane-anchored ribosome-binding protein
MDNSSSGGASQLKENVRGSITSVGASASDSVARGRDAIGAAASNAIGTAGSDLQSLRTDLDRLKDTVSAFMAQAAKEATRSVREVSSNVVDRVGDVADDIAQRGSTMASATTAQANKFVSEFESMARRNPIGTMAGAMLVGIMIGMLGRRR